MGQPPLSGLIGRADVFDSSCEKGEVRCSLGYRSQQVGTDDGACGWGPDGYLARPNVYDATAIPPDYGNAIALYLKDGNRKHVLGFHDARFSKQAGNLQPGDRAIVTKGEVRFLMKQATQTVSLYAVNEKVDQSMMVSVGGKDGELLLLNGKAFLRMSTDVQGKAKITIGCGAASITLKEDGTIQLDGANFIAATQRGCLGLMSPQPPIVPPPVLNGIAYSAAGPVNAISANWTVAP